MKKGGKATKMMKGGMKKPKKGYMRGGMKKPKHK